MTETDTPTLSEDQSVTYREFTINSINLIGQDGRSVDIRTLVQEIILRQDIHIGYLHGEILMLDAIDLIHDMVITGGEYVWLHLSTPHNNTIVRKIFRVHKVSERFARDNAQVYTMHLVSDEMFLSETVLINKAYKREKISVIAEDIIRNHFKAPSYVVDNTDVPQNIIIPNLRPTAALNWLASRATFGSDSCFMFFETLNGLQFRNLRTMYDEPVVNKYPYLRQISSADRGRIDDSETAYFLVDRYNFRRDFDLLRLSKEGGIATDFVGIDPVHRTVTHTYNSILDMSTQFNEPRLPNFQLPNGNFMYDNFGGKQIIGIQTTETANELSNNAEKWHKRNTQLSALYNSLCEVTVPGSLDVQAGSMVAMMFEVMAPVSVDDRINEMLSGDYFASSVAHTFNFQTSRFDTTIALFRDTLPRKLVATDTALITKMDKLRKTKATKS